MVTIDGEIGTAVDHAMEILPSSGLANEAYARCAIATNRGTTILAIFWQGASPADSIGGAGDPP